MTHFQTAVLNLGPKMFDAFSYAFQGKKCQLSLLLWIDIIHTRNFVMSADGQWNSRHAAANYFLYVSGGY